MRRVLHGFTICWLWLSQAELYCQDMELNWLHSFGSKQEDAGRFIKTDQEGNVYFLGSFYDTIDFDPGMGKAEFISQGFADIVFAKYRNNGELIWARTIGGPLMDNAYSFDLDSDGNMYITGSFVQTVDMDPGSGILNYTAKGGPDVFISKINPDGLLIWSKIITGNANAYSQDIKLDLKGNLFVTGYFNDKIDINPGLDSLILVSPNNKSDIFLLKLNPNGEFLWGFNSGGKNHEYPNALAPDKNGDVFLAMSFEDTVDFDPRPTNTALKTSIGYRNAGLVKYSAAGEFLWVNHFNGTCINSISSIAIDTNADCYITGFIEGNTDFNPSAAYTVLSSNGLYDFFIAKYRSDGGLVWAKSGGGVSYDGGSCIELDKLQNIYVGGNFNSTVDFDPSAGIQNQTSAGGTDIFLCKYTHDGQLLKSYRFGGSGDDGIASIDIRINLDFFIAGSFNSTVDFDPSANTANRTAVGWVDMYVGKYAQCKPIVSNIQISKCNSYISPSTKYEWTESGNYTDTLTAINGCDSILNIALTITKSKITHSYVKACKGYTWLDGKQYFSSTDTPKYYIPLGTGCDSIVQLHLTIEKLDTMLWLKIDSLYSKQDSANYQWEDCQKGIIPGANQRTFRPHQSGSYRLILEKNECRDTTHCMKCELLSIEKTEVQEPKFYPIPSINGKLTVQLPSKNIISMIKIFNPEGKLEKIIHDLHFHTIEIDLSGRDGLYIFEIHYVHGEILYKKITNISEPK